MIEMPASRCRTPPPRKGFTLLELMVVAVLMILVTAISAQFWRYFRHQVADLTHRAQASQELRMAIESLRGDLGQVRVINAVGSERMRIHTGPAGDEEVIEYYVADGRLIRKDATTGQTVPLAAKISQFQVQNLTASTVRMVVGVTSGPITRQSALLWSQP